MQVQPIFESVPLRYKNDLDTYLKKKTCLNKAINVNFDFLYNENNLAALSNRKYVSLDHLEINRSFHTHPPSRFYKTLYKVPEILKNLNKVSWNITVVSWSSKTKNLSKFYKALYRFSDKLSIFTFAVMKGGDKDAQKLRCDPHLLINLLKYSQNLSIVRIHTYNNQLISKLLMSPEVHNCRYTLHIDLQEGLKLEDLISISSCCFRIKIFSFNFLACLWNRIFKNRSYGKNFPTRRQAMTRIYQYGKKYFLSLQSIFEEEDFEKYIEQ